jgi:hypothetical protein
MPEGISIRQDITARSKLTVLPQHPNGSCGCLLQRVASPRPARAVPPRPSGNPAGFSKTYLAAKGWAALPFFATTCAAVGSRFTARLIDSLTAW